MLEVLIYVFVTTLFFLGYVFYNNRKNTKKHCKKCSFKKQEVIKEKHISKRKLLGSPRK